MTTPEPKPLSKETREEIEQRGHEYDPHPPFWNFIQELLAAERYWREAVKNADHNNERCAFCVGFFYGNVARRTLQHKPDCPWLLAQE